MTQLAIRHEEPELLIPDEDVSDPQLSIVIPALDEALTIEEFVCWCRQGLAAAGVHGEILIVDSSTDGTAEWRMQRVPASCACPSEV